VAVVAVAAVVALLPAWRAPGWSLWRRIHQSAFALSLMALAGFMLQWGLAFGGAV